MKNYLFKRSLGTIVSTFIAVLFLSANLLPATASSAKDEGKSNSALTLDQMKEVAIFMVLQDKGQLDSLAQNHTKTNLVNWVQNSSSLDRPPRNGCFNDDVLNDLKGQVKALLTAKETSYTFGNGVLVIYGPGATKSIGKYIELDAAKKVASTFSEKDIAGLEDETKLILVIGLKKEDVQAIQKSGVKTWSQGQITAKISSFSGRP